MRNPEIPRILAYQLAQALTETDLARVSGGGDGLFSKLNSLGLKALKSTSFSGPNGAADDCQEPAD